MKGIFPQPGDTFLGWLGRVFFIVCLVLGTLWAIGYHLIQKEQAEVYTPPYKWEGLDPNRPVSEISHLDYSTGTVYYIQEGEYKGNKNKKTIDYSTSNKYTDEEIEQWFLDNDMANEYEDLYEKFRD